MESFCFNDIEALCVELPEEIEKKKWHGDFEGAIALIDRWQQRDIPEKLHAKLRMEKEILKILPHEYPLTKAEAMAIFRERIPDITEREFDELKDDGKIDWIYVNGEEHFFSRFLSVLLKVNPVIRERAGITDKNGVRKNPGDIKEVQDLSDIIDRIRKEGTASCRFRMRCGLRITDGAFRPGKVTVHLPVPVNCMQVRSMRVLSASSDPSHYYVSGENAPQRTICFQEELQENKEFFVEYEFVNTVQYHDFDPDSGLNEAIRQAAAQEILTPDNIGPGRKYAEVLPEDLAEQLPHIRFTPYMRSLAEKLTAGLDDPLSKAKRIYDYITKYVEYSYVRTYFTIEDLSEYAAIGRKGDCGIQALMFITLCRICGIPARWQSGLDMSPYEAGCHDWAQFYCAPFGWVFSDPSFGGGANRSGQEKKRRFYFGNVEPWRMPANGAFQKEFDPPKHFLRVDPYDNQSGEVEYEDRGLNKYEFDSTYQVEECAPVPAEGTALR
jgi:hypothetical protein